MRRTLSALIDQAIVYLMFCSLLSLAEAAPIRAGSAAYEYSNVFTSRLFADVAPFFLPEQMDVPVLSQGVFATEWQDQPAVGAPIPFEIVSGVADGALPGKPPIPFQLLIGIQQVPQLGPFLGTYSNVVQDETDPGFDTGDPSSLESAFVQVAGPFAQILIDGTTFYSTPYTFEGNIAALPYPVGTEFVGKADTEVRWQMGDKPNPLVDPVVGLALAGGVVRVDRIIPEPSAMFLTLLCAVASIGVFRSGMPLER